MNVSSSTKDSIASILGVRQLLGREQVTFIYGGLNATFRFIKDLMCFV